MRLLAIALYMIAHAHQVHVVHAPNGGLNGWIDAYRHWAVGIGYDQLHHLSWFLQFSGDR